MICEKFPDAITILVNMAHGFLASQTPFSLFSFFLKSRLLMFLLAPYHLRRKGSM
jgi:hypothetical protein